MATDKDITKDMEEFYNAAAAHWGTYWEEAKLDLKFRMGDQYSTKDKNYLKSMDREALVWNKTHRIVNLIAGYEVKNLLALKVDPFEGADEKTASQLSAIVMRNMLQGGGYATQSAAFEFGPIITGMNLIEHWVDKTEDMLNGDIRFRRLPYNRFVLDPTFQERDLDQDCGGLMTRDYFSKEACKSLLPDRAKDINMMKVTNGSDNKFGHFYPLKGRHNEYNLKYDRYFTRVFRPFRILADTITGKMTPLPEKGDKVDEIVKLFMQRYPHLKVIQGSRKGVDLNIFVEGELMYKGPDPSGLDEYPFVLEAGYWTPESEDPKYRMQGVVRVCRDPGTETNRRRSMVLDMLDGVIRSGWKAKSGSVENPDELYQSGHATVWMSENAEMEDAQQLQQPNIPPGLFQALQIMDQDHDTIPGVNNEMLGSADNPDTEVAALLAKLRSAAGLTTLQTLFAGHRTAKTLSGRKQIKLIQRNYTPSKIQRITNEQPTQEFYKADFGKYDAVPTEGVLTDTQRQQHYAQVLAWKKNGAPIPWEHVIDFAPMEKKEELKQAVRQAEQGAQQAQQTQQQMEELAKQLINAEKVQKIASAQEKIAEAEENRANATLDRVKAAKEAQGLDLDNLGKTITLLQQMQAALSGKGATNDSKTVGGNNG